MTEIIPTIFATSKRMFDEKFTKLLDVSKKLQIDFMDGQFVTKRSIKLTAVPSLRDLDNEFEAHLMVTNPRSWIKRLKNKGFKKVIFHYSAMDFDEEETRKLANDIRKLDMLAFVAINPEVREDEIFGLLDDVDGILIMGVHPGREKQHLLDKTHWKLKNIRKINNKIVLQVDGGVNPITAPELIKSGADILNSGSFVSRSNNPKEALQGLLDSLKR
jgi:ribulose-phosphate 3-epimerase